MKHCDNILYFLNGSIGDFLMVVSLLEQIHIQDTSKKLYLITPRNTALFNELLVAYPYITVVHAHKGNVHTVLARFFFKKNCCITPPTPGRIPLATKGMAKALSLRGCLVGFDDGSVLNRYLYGYLISHDFTRLYYDNLLDVMNALNLPRGVVVPSLQMNPSLEVLKKWNVSSQEYVVVHPFGSSHMRSIEGQELSTLIDTLIKHKPHLTILISGSAADEIRIPKMVQDTVRSIAGRVTLSELATLIQESALYIGVDTGVTHLASVLGARSLVVAHNGTAHWLPYYNENATILFQVEGDTSQVHEGRMYLENQRNGRLRFLTRVPFSVVEHRIAQLLA